MALYYIGLDLHKKIIAYCPRVLPYGAGHLHDHAGHERASVEDSLSPVDATCISNGETPHPQETCHLQTEDRHDQLIHEEDQLVQEA